MGDCLTHSSAPLLPPPSDWPRASILASDWLPSRPRPSASGVYTRQSPAHSERPGAVSPTEELCFVYSRGEYILQLS